MARGCLAIVALAGCNQVFDLRSTVIQDGSAAIDAPPPVAFVQIAVNEAASASVHLTFPQPVTAGDALIAAIYVQSGGPPAITDDLGNAFTAALPGTPYAMLPGGMLYLFTALDASGGSDGITVSAAGATDVLVYAHEFAHVAALDGAASRQGDGYEVDGMRSGPIATTGPNELIIGFGIARAVAAGTGFISLSSLDSNCTEWRADDSGGMVEATASNVSFQDTAWTLVGATFRGR